MSDNTPSFRHDLKIIFYTLAGIALVCMIAIKGVNTYTSHDDEITAKKFNKKSVLKKPRKRA